MELLTCLLLLVYLPVGQFSISNSTSPGSQSISALSTIDHRSEVTEFQNTNTNMPELEDSLQHLYEVIGLEKFDLSFEVFKYGMIGYYSLRQQGKLGDKELLSIIDFTKSSTKKRFYTIDLTSYQVKYHTYVSHGKNTGEDLATKFSNTVHSNQSSLGFYITAETYIGSKGYSLKLDGVEKGYNDNLRERAVVMHSAEYVSEYWVKQYGRLGRSQGCPALPSNIAKEVIDTIKDHTAIFAYYNDQTYLNTSSYLDMNRLQAPGTLTAKLSK